MRTKTAEEFAARVRLRCELALGTAKTFPELLEEVDGADPLVVLQALERMAEAGGPLMDQAAAVAGAARGASCEPAPSPIPIAHPLDYHWRFAEPTITALGEAIKQRTAVGDIVVHMGTPSLFRYACRVLADRRHLLLDRDRRAVDSPPPGGEARPIDLTRDQVPALGAAVCIADPPWYPGAMSGFINAAAVMLRPEGSLLISFPRTLTRPGIAVDRRLLIDSAGGDGLYIDREFVMSCQYETPPFEVAAMAAGGLRCPPTAWRVGEVIRFIRSDEGADRIIEPNAPEWAAYEADQIPLRARASAPSRGDELLGSAVPGDILPTVSRRDPIRDVIALWTSRNRVFTSVDATRLCEVVADIAAGREPQDADAVTAKRIRELVALERQEHQLPPLKTRTG